METVAKKAPKGAVKSNTQAVKVSNYKLQVLDPHTKAGAILGSVGAWRDWFLTNAKETGLTVAQIEFLTLTREKGANGKMLYEQLNTATRRNKKGFTCRFYVLQALYKCVNPKAVKSSSVA